MNIKKHKIILTLITGFFLLSLIGCSEDASAGKFVAISNGGPIVYSDDGIQWNNTNKDSAFLNSVCYGNGKFVAVGHDNLVVYSLNGGNTWQDAKLPNNNAYWSSVCYGNGRFVAVSYNAIDCRAAYSTDGETWYRPNVPTGLQNDEQWDKICYGGGKFVTIAFGSDHIAFSHDGIKWETNTAPDSAPWKSVCYGKGKFVAVANNNIAAYSTDGITWTIKTTEVSAAWESVCYGNGKFVAVAAADPDPVNIGESIPCNTVEYSTDGITWHEAELPKLADWRGVCYGNGKFVAVAREVTGTAAYSYDGIKWHKIEGMPEHLWQTVAYGLDNEVFGFL